MKLLTSLLIALSLSTSVYADTLSYNGSAYSSVGYVDVYTPSKHYVGGAGLGSFKNVTSDYDFNGFCIEVEQNSSFSSQYSKTQMNSSDSRYDKLNRLFTNWYDKATLNGETMTAFALAVWKIQYDSKSILDLSTGVFRLNNASGNISDYARQMITTGNDINAKTDNWAFNTWLSSKDQDFLEAVPTLNNVPVPATAFLILPLALLAFALSKPKAVMLR